jgi:TIR domain
MKVFISWSGERSRQLAETLRSWLPTVIQAVEPWMSKSDLNKGGRWGIELASELEHTKVGIICLTPENTNNPWLVFEAGALSKTLPDTYVCPLLFHLQPTDIDGPLSQFQATIADKNDLRSLLKTINAAQGADALPVERLDKAFELAWPELDTQLTQVPSPSPDENQPRPTKDMVREILGIIRLQAKEVESRDDDFYRSRDSFLAIVINLLKTGIPSDSTLPPEIVEHVENFNRYTSAYLDRRDIGNCPDCHGTGYAVAENKGVRRCDHTNLDELESRGTANP